MVRDASRAFTLRFWLFSPCVHSKHGVSIGASPFKTCTGKALVK